MGRPRCRPFCLRASLSAWEDVAAGGGTGEARMLGARFRSACIAAVAVFSMATPLVAQGIDIDAAWRRMFARPASPPPAPADNPLAADRIALGARLFADTRLSGSGDRSCATCHRPEQAFTDGRRRRSRLSGAPLATQYALAVEPRLGQALLLGRTRALARGAGGACRSRRPRRWAATGRRSCGRLEADDDLVGQFRAALRGGARRLAGDTSLRRSPPTCARSCRRRRASMPGSTARDGAAPCRGARLPPVHRQGRLRALPRGLALHRRPLPRHRPARAATPAAARCRAARRA